MREILLKLKRKQVEHPRQNWPVWIAFLLFIMSLYPAVYMLSNTQYRHQAGLAGPIMSASLLLLLNVLFVFLLTILSRNKRTYWLKAIPLGGLVAILLGAGVLWMVNSYLDWKDDPRLIEGRIVKVVHSLPSKGSQDYYNVAIWMEGEKEPFNVGRAGGLTCRTRSQHWVRRCGCLKRIKLRIAFG
jgi:hypothetical protein